MSRFMIFRSLRETNCQMGISHNQLVVPTSFSSALRTNRFNDIPSLIDFRTASCFNHMKGLKFHFSEKAGI
jgi:hypothetical protein